MLAAVKFDAMQGLCSAADAVGFTVERAMPASLALVNSFRYNYPDLLESVIVVNVGARTTNLLFLEGDRFYVRTLALAGNAVTTSISEELKIDFASAETLKVQVLSGTSDLPAASPSRAVVQRAASAFSTRLQMEITRSAVNHRRQSGGGAPVALYLTGGGSLIEELPALLADRIKVPGERFQALKNVDVSADARVSGAENSAPVLADLVGLATRRVSSRAAELSQLPPELTAAIAFRKRQPRFIGAAGLLAAALVPPILYFHQVTTATLEQVSRVDGQLMPLRSIENRNGENSRQIDEASKQIRALRGAYETKANWINFLADLQERLVKIEDVWLDRIQVVRPPMPEPGAAQAEPPPADANAAAPAEPAAPKGPPLRLTLSGRLLDVSNPQSKVSPESLQRVKQLLASFTGSQFVTAVENERFDTNQNGLLRFDFTLVINPKKTL
jgi:type IV pilus assembly protein PilM